MKATGMVRTVDNLGRVVLPKALRRNLGIYVGDTIEFYVDDSSIVIKKYDLVGDIDQVLDNLCKVLDIKSDLMTPEQAGALLAKAQEMKSILKKQEG